MVDGEYANPVVWEFFGIRVGEILVTENIESWAGEPIEYLPPGGCDASLRSLTPSPCAKSQGPDYPVTPLLILRIRKFSTSAQCRTLSDICDMMSS